MGGESCTLLRLRVMRKLAMSRSYSSYKIDYLIVMKIFLTPEGHQNCICGSKVTVISLQGLILPIGGVAPAACAAGLFQHISISLFQLFRIFENHHNSIPTFQHFSNLAFQQFSIQHSSILDILYFIISVLQYFSIIKIQCFSIPTFYNFSSL